MEESENEHYTKNVVDHIIEEETKKMAELKQRVQKEQILRTGLAANTRVIESSSSRLVHFIFNPNAESRVSSFTRKLKLMLKDELEDFERNEREKLEKYLEMYVDEQLDESDHYPVYYEKNDFYELELNQVNKVAFGVADNPFFKVQTDKYYPEAVVMNSNGEVLAHLGGEKL